MLIAIDATLPRLFVFYRLHYYAIDDAMLPPLSMPPAFDAAAAACRYFSAHFRFDADAADAICHADVFAAIDAIFAADHATLFLRFDSLRFLYVEATPPPCLFCPLAFRATLA